MCPLEEGVPCSFLVTRCSFYEDMEEEREAQVHFSSMINVSLLCECLLEERRMMYCRQAEWE